MCIFATDMRKLLYISVFFLLLASCTDDKEVMPVLERAEAYLPEYPDSAGMLLDSISSRPLGDSGERVRSLYGLLRTMTDAMTGKGVTTDSLIRSSYIYYKEQGESDEHTRRLGRSAFYLAQFEASRDSTKRAEDLYREAIRCSEKVEDWRMCYMAYSWLAREKTWSDKEEAIRLLKTAVGIYHKIEDKPANLISMYLDLSNNHLALQHYGLALDYVNKAYDIACAENLEIQKSDALRNLSVYYYETGDFPKALELAKQGMQGLTDQTRDASLFSLADCYLACDSLEQAKTVLLSINMLDAKTKYVVFEDLLKIAHAQKDYEAAMRYADSLEAATVDMFTNIQQTKEAYYQDNLKKELYNMQLSQRKRQQVIILWGTIILIVVIAVFIVIIINKNRRIAVQKRATTVLLRKRDYQKHITEISKYEQALNDKVQQIINLQINSNNHLSTEKAEKAQLLLQYNQLQEQFAKFVLRDTDLLQKINPEKQVGPLTPNEWEQLAIVINQNNNNCIFNLRNDFPELSETDIRICMLTMLGLSNTQISEVLERTSSTVKKRKHNIKTAIFGVQDTNIHFEIILRRLCS